MLNESPAGANECDGDEQQGPFQAAREKNEQTPMGLFSISLWELECTARSMISRTAGKRQVARLRQFTVSEEHFQAHAS